MGSDFGPSRGKPSISLCTSRGVECRNHIDDQDPRMRLTLPAALHLTAAMVDVRQRPTGWPVRSVRLGFRSCRDLGGDVVFSSVLGMRVRLTSGLLALACGCVGGCSGAQ